MRHFWSAVGNFLRVHSFLTRAHSPRVITCSSGMQDPQNLGSATYVILCYLLQFSNDETYHTWLSS